jgi:hypothetical protein
VRLLAPHREEAVEDRNAGLPPAIRWARMIDDRCDLLKTCVADSKGKIRGDKAHQRLIALVSPAPTAPPVERWRRSKHNGD